MFAMANRRIFCHYFFNAPAVRRAFRTAIAPSAKSNFLLCKFWGYFFVKKPNAHIFANLPARKAAIICRLTEGSGRRLGENKVYWNLSRGIIKSRSPRCEQEFIVRVRAGLGDSCI